MREGRRWRREKLGAEMQREEGRREIKRIFMEKRRDKEEKEGRTDKRYRT